MPQTLETDTTTYKAKIAVRASRPEVWKALTEPRTIDKWFLRNPKIDLREGGSYELHCGNTMVQRVQFLEIAPHEKLAFTWDTSRRVSFFLEATGEETVVILDVTGYRPAGNGLQVYVDEIKGWTFYPVNLKTYLERGWDLREPDAKRTFDQGWINSYD